MKKLISMVDFVLEQDLQIPIGRTAGQMIKYANFLKQPLELCMFIPCKLVDGVWVVLEEPDRDNNKYDVYDREFCYFNDGLFLHDEQEYQEAKDRVLFEGFSLENKGQFTVWIQKENHSICFTDRGKININSQNERTVEDVIKYEFLLTPNALKQLGL